MDSRLVLRGILFVLITEIGWEDLPQELGFGSGMTCWRRLRDWQAAGAFEQIHQAVLARCHAARLIDTGDGRRLARAGEKRGAATGPSPVDRAKTGSKHHILTCANGFPLAVALSAANVNDTCCCPRCSTESGPCAGGRAEPGNGSRPGSPTRATTIQACIPNCGNDVSPATSLAAAPATRSPPAAGSLSKPSPCFTSTVGWPSDGNDAPTSTTDSSTSPQP